MCPKQSFTPIVLIVLTVSLLTLACDAPSPFDRLVDLSQREGAISSPDGMWLRATDTSATRDGGASVLPVATIDHDTRYVLAAHPHHVLASRKDLLVKEEGLTIFAKDRGELFPDAESLLIRMRIFVFGDLDWRIQPPLIHPLEKLGEDPLIKIDFFLDDVAKGNIIHAWIDAYQTPPPGGTRYVTAARPIPEYASLEFSYGILEAAAFQGPVEFEISACDGDVCESLFSDVFDPEQEARSAWQDRRISLSPVWGQTRSLMFEAVPVNAEAQSLPVWGNPRVVVTPEATTRPNVILLSIDTLRRDHLSVYGYPRETAPFLNERLAPGGAVFENMISEAATTEVSHMSLFSSLPALVHGVTAYDFKLAVPVELLGESFRQNDFDTAAFTEAGPLDPRLGFAIGFDRWKENPNIHFLFPSGQVERVLSQGWDWIVQRHERPFFLFLHTFQVHHPLSPPYPYRQFFVEDLADGGERSEEEEQVARYDREIRYVDDQLALFWQKLEDSGLAKNTILVIVSDHGDEFWEHGERGHASLPYEEVLQVPFIVIGPKIKAGLRSQRPLHHIDVMPTILDLVGLPIPEDVLGTSFADSARGLDSQPETVSTSRLRTSASWAVPKGVSRPAFAIRDQKLKVIRYEEDGEAKRKCFDLENDPDEKADLCLAGPTEAVLQLLARFETYESEMNAVKLALAPPASAGESDNEPETVPVSPDQEEQLRALGYVE